MRASQIHTVGAACYLVIQSANVHGGVSRGILGTGVSTIKKEVLQMLRMAVLAGLGERGSRRDEDRAKGQG